MTNTDKLNEVIDRSGLKLLSIAERMNLSYFGLYKKINNITEFKASEIVRMVAILNLSKGDREAIFFANEGD